MLRFNELADRVLAYDPECDFSLLQRAYVFTAKVHEGQERLSGEPYLVHPLDVAGILAEMRLDTLTIIAGLLHDTVEDTLTTPEEIKRLFGGEVAFLVDGLTKISKVEFSSPRARQAENFRKMLVAMSKDIRILLIKLADRLHNMRTLHYLPEEKARRIAQETDDIYVPLAHRLGINWVKRELEDLSFRTLHPEAAAELEQQLHRRSGERSSYIKEVQNALETQLQEAGLQGEVQGRLKELASIHAKMVRQASGLEKIYDVIAFRVVLTGGASGAGETGAVYHALGLVHALWPPVPGRFKDYIALPKSNGYQSLHTTVIGPYGERMEIQFRTQAMHRAAEFGIAAHWKYKGAAGETSAAGDADAHKFDWLRQLVERQGELQDPHEFLDVVKVDLFPDDVFVFTPKGDVIRLPTGATALDFAYAIHSEVGDRCAGARVNGTQRPLSQRLGNGDTVEAQTNAKQRPRKDWLEFVVSGKARARIRHAVREEEKARSRELGRNLLERECKKNGMPLRRMLEAEALAPLLKRLGGEDALLAAVGYGKQSAPDLVRAARGQSAEAAPTSAAPASAAPKSRRERLGALFRRAKPGARADADSAGIRVDGHPDVLVRFGKCCAPLPGDECMGFVTRGRGVTVHARDCRVAFGLDPQRRVEVDWRGEGAARRVPIRVTSRDEPGLLAEITRAISALGVNIGGADIHTHEDRSATQRFELWVEDAQKLAGVMRQIGRIRGVKNVERIRG